MHYLTKFQHSQTIHGRIIANCPYSLAYFFGAPYVAFFSIFGRREPYQIWSG